MKWDGMGCGVMKWVEGRNDSEEGNVGEMMWRGEERDAIRVASAV